jgi:hypothetical protein
MQHFLRKMDFLRKRVLNGTHEVNYTLLPLNKFFLSFFGILGFELRDSRLLGGCSYYLSHSTSP